MLVCFECRNTTDFVQVSGRDDARDLVQTSAGLRRHPWGRPDEREPGLYCGKCAEPLENDVDEERLADDRIDFVLPADFDADAFARELLELRSDATWERLELDAREPSHAALPSSVHPAIRSALERVGRLPLYTHQAASIEAAARGENVVIATSAGSGKSIGFLVPVLDRLLRDDRATAILTFPLRALANDQIASLERLSVTEPKWFDHSNLEIRLTDDAAPIRVARYDGSSKQHERKEMRQRARLLIATPDILHHSVLRMGVTDYKDGTSWRRLFRGLQFIVLARVSWMADG